ncbi:MAG: histidine phosphatase family protein, partial [Myxococcales bacterium]|nr:histidine phosphatase family protein [Myxococcales bacterium]
LRAGSRRLETALELARLDALAAAGPDAPALARAVTGSQRGSLPALIILVRHGESEGNADHTLYRSKPDNLIELTDEGSAQARVAGRRVRAIVGPRRCAFVVSPFERTLQTARNLRLAFDAGQITRASIEPLIREQEFGNLQGDDFARFRREQQRVGRFWYRFPTGESGADVYSRTRAWWDGDVLRLNTRPGVPPVDALIVVTHGLTMRLILMQLFGWSPNTFGTVWNADHCDCYVLRRDDASPGVSPYRLDDELGDAPRSSINLGVTFNDGAPPQTLLLHDYLSVPAPRTTNAELVKLLLAAQHGLDATTIDQIDFFAGRAGYGAGVPPPRKYR